MSSASCASVASSATPSLSLSLSPSPEPLPPPLPKTREEDATSPDSKSDRPAEETEKASPSFSDSASSTTSKASPSSSTSTRFPFKVPVLGATRVRRAPRHEACPSVLSPAERGGPLPGCGADPGGRSALHKAIDEKNFLFAIELIRQQKGINKRDSTGRTPIFSAVETGNASLVQSLLDAKAFVDILDFKRNTPLSIAVSAICVARKQRDSFKLQRTKLSSSQTQEEVQLATQINLLSANIDRLSANIDLLLEKGGGPEKGTLNPEEGEGFSGTTPLHIATAFREVEIMKKLIYPSTVNLQDERGRTALHLAVDLDGGDKVLKQNLGDHQFKKISEHALNLLLGKGGADPNIADGNGNTPLFIPVDQNMTQFAYILVKSGARFHATNKKNETPFQLAINNPLMVKQFMITSPRHQPPAAASLASAPPLHTAIAHNQDSALLVLQKTQNITELDSAGNSPLHLAAQHRSLDLIKELIRKCETVKDGDTPEKIAVRKKEMLHAKNEQGDTPLHIAAQNGFDAIVTLLLEHKTYPTVVNHQGDTPLLLAQKNRHPSTVRILNDALSVTVDMCCSSFINLVLSCFVPRAAETPEQLFVPVHPDKHLKATSYEVKR